MTPMCRPRVAAVAARVEGEDRRPDVADGQIDLVDRELDPLDRRIGCRAGDRALQGQTDREKHDFRSRG